MQSNKMDGIQFTIAECRALMTSLKLRDEQLEKLSLIENDENKQLLYDEERQDIEGIIKSIINYARIVYEMEVE